MVSFLGIKAKTLVIVLMQVPFDVMAYIYLHLQNPEEGNLSHRNM